MRARITALGNEGFEINVGGIVILFDPFFRSFPGIAPRPWRSASETRSADLILVTHAHWDHFNERGVLEALQQTNAKLVGPQTVIRKLRGLVPESNLIQLEPRHAGAGKPASETADVRLKSSAAVESAGTTHPMLRIVAFRTFHSKDHNSYLVDANGFRMFHDGDNEDTRRFDVEALRPLDALFIGPWQGSGWVEFIEAVQPRKWFLMHLDESELDQHERGEYLTELCDRVPQNLVVLRPGQSVAM